MRDLNAANEVVLRVDGRIPEVLYLEESDGEIVRILGSDNTAADKQTIKELTAAAASAGLQARSMKWPREYRENDFLKVLKPISTWDTGEVLPKKSVLILQEDVRPHSLRRAYKVIDVKAKKFVYIGLFDFLVNVEFDDVNQKRDFVTSKASSSIVIPDRLAEEAAKQQVRTSTAVDLFARQVLDVILKPANWKDRVDYPISFSGIVGEGETPIPTTVEGSSTFLLAEGVTLAQAVQTLVLCPRYSPNERDLLNYEPRKFVVDNEEYGEGSAPQNNATFCLISALQELCREGHKKFGIYTIAARAENIAISKFIDNSQALRAWEETRDSRTDKGMPPLSRHKYRTLKEELEDSNRLREWNPKETPELASSVDEGLEDLQQTLRLINERINAGELDRLFVRLGLIKFVDVGQDIINLVNVLANILLTSQLMFTAITRRSARNALKRGAAAYERNNKIRAGEHVDGSLDISETESPSAEVFWRSAAEAILKEIAWGFGVLDWRSSIGGTDTTEKILSRVAKLTAKKFIRAMFLSDLDVRDIFNVWCLVTYGRSPDAIRVTEIADVDKFMSFVQSSTVYEGIRDKSALVKATVTIAEEEWRAWKKIVESLGEILTANPKSNSLTNIQTASGEGAQRRSFIFRDTVRYLSGLGANLRNPDRIDRHATRNPSDDQPESPEGSFGISLFDDIDLGSLDLSDIAVDLDSDLFGGLDLGSVLTDAELDSMVSPLQRVASGADYLPDFIESCDEFAVLLDPIDLNMPPPFQYLLDYIAEKAKSSGASKYFRGDGFKLDVKKLFPGVSDEETSELADAALIVINGVSRLAREQHRREHILNGAGLDNASLAMALAIMDIYSESEEEIRATSSSVALFTARDILGRFRKTQATEQEIAAMDRIGRILRRVGRENLIQRLQTHSDIVSGDDVERLLLESEDALRDLAKTRLRTKYAQIRNTAYVKISPMLEIGKGYDYIGRVKIEARVFTPTGQLDTAKSNSIRLLIVELFAVGATKRTICVGTEGDVEDIYIDDFSVRDYERLSALTQAGFGRLKNTQIYFAVDPGCVALKMVSWHKDSDGNSVITQLPEGARPVILQWINWSNIPGNRSAAAKAEFAYIQETRKARTPLLLRTFSDAITDAFRTVSADSNIVFTTPTSPTNEVYLPFFLPQFTNQATYTEQCFSTVVSTTYSLLDPENKRFTPGVLASMQMGAIVVGKPGIVKVSELSRVSWEGPEIKVFIHPDAYAVAVQTDKGSTSLGNLLVQFGANADTTEEHRVGKIRSGYARVKPFQVADINIDNYLNLDALKELVVSAGDKEGEKILRGKAADVVNRARNSSIAFDKLIEELSSESYRRLDSFVSPILRFYKGDLRNRIEMTFIVSTQMYPLFVEELQTYLNKCGLKKSQLKSILGPIREGMIDYLREVQLREKIYKESVGLKTVVPKWVDLKQHQHVGTRFLFSRKYAILADDRGLGKTIQAILAGETVVPEDEQILVIVPANLVENFAIEISKFAMNKAAVIARRERSDIVRKVSVGKDVVDIHIPARNDWRDIEKYRWVIMSIDTIKSLSLNIGILEPVRTAKEIIQILSIREEDKKKKIYLTWDELEAKLNSEPTAAEFVKLAPVTPGAIEELEARARFQRTAILYFVYSAVLELGNGMPIPLNLVEERALRLYTASDFVMKRLKFVELGRKTFIPNSAIDVLTMSKQNMIEIVSAVAMVPWDSGKVRQMLTKGELLEFMDITTDETPLQKHILHKRWALVIYDEAHLYKNRKTARFKLAERIMPNASRAWFLTGTPMAQRVEDMWPLLRLIHHPLGAGENESDFVARYGNGERGSSMPSPGITRQAELKKTTSDVVLWRYKDDVADIPVQEIYQKKVLLKKGIEDMLFGNFGDMREPEDNLVARAMHDFLLNYWRTLGISNPGTIERLVLAAFGPCSVYANFYSTSVLGAQSRVRGVIAVLKAPLSLMEAIAAIMSGEKVIIFTHSSLVANWLCETSEELATLEDRIKEGKEPSSMEQALLVKYSASSLTRIGKGTVLVDGTVGREKIQEGVSRFTTEPDCVLLVGNIATAGTGLNLQAATTSIFNDIPYAAYLAEQAEDRTRRIGQEKMTTVIWMVCDAYTDEQMWKNLTNRRSLIEMVQEGRDAPTIFVGSLTDTDDVVGRTSARDRAKDAQDEERRIRKIQKEIEPDDSEEDEE